MIMQIQIMKLSAGVTFNLFKIQIMKELASRDKIFTKTSQCYEFYLYFLKILKHVWEQHKLIK